MGQSRQAGFWTVSSDGRASASHAEGHRFESCTVHNALTDGSARFAGSILASPLWVCLVAAVKGAGSSPAAERNVVCVRKNARLGGVGWPPRCLVGRVFVRGIVLVGAPPDVHGWCARVRVPLPRLWVVSSVDRAPGYEPGCRRFESCTAHGSMVFSTPLGCGRVHRLRASGGV